MSNSPFLPFQLTLTLLGGVWTGSGHPHMDVNLRGGGSGKQIKAKWERDNSIIETLSEMQGKHLYAPPYLSMDL